MLSKIKFLTLVMASLIIFSCGKNESPTQETNTEVLENNYLQSTNALESHGVILGCSAPQWNQDIKCGSDSEAFEKHITGLEESGFFDTQEAQREYFQNIISLLEEYYTQTELFVKHCDELHYSDCHTANFNNMSAYNYFVHIRVEIRKTIIYFRGYLDLI